LSAAFAQAEAADLRPVDRRLPRRHLLLAAGLAALILCAAVPAYISLGGHRVASLSTAEALDQVATAAVENPLPFAREDQFLYTRSRGTYVWTAVAGAGPNATSFSALVTNRRKAWVSLDRQGAMQQQRVGLKWITARDRKNYRARSGRGDVFGARSSTSGLAPDHRYFFLGTEMTRSQLEHATTDPKTIYGLTLKRLNGAGEGDADGVWQALTEQLYEYAYPAKVRAGMVRALGLIPGVTTLGRMRDPLGREGIAISRDNLGTRDVVLFDDANSSVIYQRSAIIGKTQDGLNWPVGTIISDYLAYEQKVVDELPPSVEKKLPPASGKAHTSVGLAGN
jgi:hypothetical protein